MAAENLSGIPPVVSLSGLPGGSFSGASQQDLSGVGGYGQGLPGMEGGLDLQQLLQMLAGGDTPAGGVGTGGDMLGGLGAGSFSQPSGGLSAGSFSGGGQSYAAGQSANAGGTGGIGAGSADPLAIAQKVLGLASKGAGLLSQTGTASPTITEKGEIGGESLQDQIRAAETASPLVSPFDVPGDVLSAAGGGLAGSAVPAQAGLPPIPPSGGSAPSQFGAAGNPNAITLDITNQWAGGNIPPGLTELGVTAQNLPAFMSAMESLEPGQIQNFLAEALTGGVPQISSAGFEAPGGLTSGTGSGGLGGLSGAGGGMNLGGALGGGLQGAGGILGLLSAIQSGNFQGIPQNLLSLFQGAGGAVNALAGAGTVPTLTANAVDAAGAGGLSAAGLINAIPGIIQMLSGGQAQGSDIRGLQNLTKPVADLSKIIAANQMAQASMAAGGAIPYAAIVAQAIQDAMAIYGIASGQQSLKSGALGAIPVIGSGVAALEQQLDENPRGWATIGKVATQMGEGAMEGGERATALGRQIQGMGGTNDPDQLMRLLEFQANALYPYYGTVQGGAAPISAADWTRRLAGGPQQGLIDRFKASQQELLNQTSGTIQQLIGSGVTGQQLGGLNVNPGWGGHGYLAGVERVPGLETLHGYIGRPEWGEITGSPAMSMIAALYPQLYQQLGGQMALAPTSKWAPAQNPFAVNPLNFSEPINPEAWGTQAGSP